MSDLSAITNAVEAEGNVVDSAIVLLTQLAQDVEASKNDPVAIQGIVDNVNAEKDRLAAAVASSTPVAPSDPPTDEKVADAQTNPPGGTTTTQDF